MTNTNSDFSRQEAPPGDTFSAEGLSAKDLVHLHSTASGSLTPLSDAEKELLRELVNALRTICYGSIVLTVHEGQLVEINKSIRIRKSRQK